MFRKTILTISLIALSLSLSLTACTNRDKNLGSEKNPVIVSFMPSATEDVMEKNADIFAKRLSEVSGLHVRAEVAEDFVSMVDKLGNKKADVAFINSLGYLLARDWSGASAIFQLKGVDGKMDYRSAIIAHTNSGINSIADLKGKSFAYTDPFSMSGYLMPLYMFTENGVKPGTTSFDGNYDVVVEKVFQKKTDGGAIYYHKPDPYGRVRDARERLITKYKDLLENVKVVALSDAIPNTPIVLRKALPEDAKVKITMAFATLSNDQTAIAALGKMYDATGFGPVDNASFKKIQEILKKLNKKIEEVVPGAVTFYKTHIWEITPEY